MKIKYKNIPSFLVQKGLEVINGPHPDGGSSDYCVWTPTRPGFITLDGEFSHTDLIEIVDFLKTQEREKPWW